MTAVKHQYIRCFVFGYFGADNFYRKSKRTENVSTTGTTMHVILGTLTWKTLFYRKMCPYTPNRLIVGEY